VKNLLCRNPNEHFWRCVYERIIDSLVRAAMSLHH
jgi:hypothetical protein